MKTRRVSIPFRVWRPFGPGKAQREKRGAIRVVSQFPFGFGVLSDLKPGKSNVADYIRGLNSLSGLASFRTALSVC